MLRPIETAAFFAPIALAACVAACSSADGTAPAAGCTKVAASGGSDRAQGSETNPYRSAERLAEALRPGETGCLRDGSYRVSTLSLRRGGRKRAPVTIRSYPGERARLVGRVVITRRARHVALRELDLDGSGAPLCRHGCRRLPSPSVFGDHALLGGNDITNRHRGICVLVGHPRYGRPQETVIRDNRIHDCGVLPPRNHDHGIYVSDADDTTITGNVIYDNADRGIQLYPDAQRSLIRNNVIDGNGEGLTFSGAGGEASSHNVVEANAITNSRERDNVEAWYPPGNPVGRGNVLRANCIHGGARDDGDGGISDERGFSAEGNLLMDPLYLNRAGKDFRLQAGSPCALIVDGF
jgi:parallel beta-helix repeat protein